jgi:hypothetical protein
MICLFTARNSDFFLILERCFCPPPNIFHVCLSLRLIRDNRLSNIHFLLYTTLIMHNNLQHTPVNSLSHTYTQLCVGKIFQIPNFDLLQKFTKCQFHQFVPHEISPDQCLDCLVRDIRKSNLISIRLSVVK